jgi:hypothetical protein
VEIRIVALVEQLDVFLASPGDVPTERRYVGQVVEELNRTLTFDKGVVLRLKCWGKDAFPGYGMDAQALINEQIAGFGAFGLFAIIAQRAQSHAVGLAEEFIGALSTNIGSFRVLYEFYISAATSEWPMISPDYRTT